MSLMFSSDRARDIVAAEVADRISKITLEIYKIKEAALRDAMELRGFPTQPDYIKAHLSCESHTNGVEKYFHDRAFFLELKTFFDPESCKWILESKEHFDNYLLEVPR